LKKSKEIFILYQKTSLRAFAYVRIHIVCHAVWGSAILMPFNAYGDSYFTNLKEPLRIERPSVMLLMYCAAEDSDPYAKAF
jgi:hypothetical protein